MNILITFVVSLPLSFAAAPSKISQDPEAELWKTWNEKYEKSYETSVEEKTRFNIWLHNLKKVNSLDTGSF